MQPVSNVTENFPVSSFFSEADFKHYDDLKISSQGISYHGAIG